VLDKLDIDIYKGETLVIMGQSGEGKSVLLRHIIGLMKPLEGEIKIEGTNIVKLNEKRLNVIRRRFGMLFQQAALFDSMNVFENVAFGLIEHSKMPREKMKKKVRELLGLVGLGEIEEMKPAELSGGMKKRVGLARAIALDPEIILYDEPTTGIDPILGDAINDLILSLHDHYHATSIVVTHDMNSAFKVADRIAMLYKGKIIQEGSAEEIINSTHPFIQQFMRSSGAMAIRDGNGKICLIAGGKK
jgi:phospholipid/cholesterol/gamma-HCH transport system ATP-binding protein